MRESVRKAIAARQQERPAALEKLAVAVEVAAQPPVHRLLLRGLHNQPGKEVQPGALAALTTPGNTYSITGAPYGTGRRTAFARWVTAPANPLFAQRVRQPCLAAPLRQGAGGHARQLRRVRSSAQPSRAARLSGAPVHRQGLVGQAVAPTDPQFRHLPPGKHNLGASPKARPGQPVAEPLPAAPAGRRDPARRHARGFRRVGAPRRRPLRANATHRRGKRRGRRGAPRRPPAPVYLQQRRTQVATLLELFDAPRITATCSVRTTSTVPVQALALLNSDFTLRRARAFADRVRRKQGQAMTHALTWRSASPMGDCPATWSARRRSGFSTSRSSSTPPGRQSPGTWADLCQMLLASNAFLYVE